MKVQAWKEQLHITPISKTMEKHEACEAKEWEEPSYYAYEKMMYSQDKNLSHKHSW